jgi:hypothetical protein
MQDAGGILTIQDVATSHRSLYRKPLAVRPDTRRRVLAAANELRLFPDLVIRDSPLPGRSFSSLRAD